MERYSYETDKFIKEVVLPRLNITDYNAENIGDIYEYIFSEIEGPLAVELECDGKLNSSDEEMLRKASKAVTEISTRYDWDKWE